MPDIFFCTLYLVPKVQAVQKPLHGCGYGGGGGEDVRDGDEWGLDVNRWLLVRQSGALCSWLQHNSKWRYNRNLNIMRFSVKARDFSCQVQGHFGSSAEKLRMRT